MNIPSLVIFGGGYNQDVTSQAFLSYMMGMNSNSQSKSDTELYSPDSVINGKDNN
jgi:acetoin utilization deacetylase AcuC-like enzyme